MNTLGHHCRCSASSPRGLNSLRVFRCQAPLDTVFSSFLRELAESEAEEWSKAADLDDHAAALQRLVGEMLPHGDRLSVVFKV